MTHNLEELRLTIEALKLVKRPDVPLVGVTTMLDKTKSEDTKQGLAAWRARVGDVEADRILNEARALGTSLDKLVEGYLIDRDGFSQIDHQEEPGWHLYSQLRLFLNDVHPLGQQVKLYSPILGLVGKPDVIAVYKDKLTIIDIKNSRREKPREWLEDYFLQCTAYAMMIHEQTGLVFEEIVLPIALRNSRIPQIERGKVKDYVGEVVRRSTLYRRTYGPTH